MQISIFTFIWYLLSTWSFTGAIKRLYDVYGDEDFDLNILWKRVHIVCNQAKAKKILQQGTSHESYANFHASHGHFNGIANHIDNENGSIIHEALKQSIDMARVAYLIDKELMDTISHNGMSFSLNDFVSQFIMNFWAKYCFGENVNMTKYRECYYDLIRLLQKNFYHSNFRGIPIIGYYVCRFNYYWNYNEQKELEKRINELQIEENSFFAKFREIIENDIVVEDNIFLNFLVYDFLYNYVMDIFLEENMKGFLFPFRVRYHEGELCIVNLIKANLPFSYGKHSCIGKNIAQSIKKKIEEFKSLFDIEISNNQIIRSSDFDIPTIISDHRVTLKLGRDYLQKILPYDEKKGFKFFNVATITQFPFLMTYINYHFKQCLKDIDCIVAPEARGWLFCPNQLPIYVARKKGKLPGETVEISYSTRYSHDIIEMNKIDFKGSRVAIIDDGVSSGGSLRAVADLVTQLNGKVMIALVVIKHSNSEYNYTGELVALFDL